MAFKINSPFHMENKACSSLKAEKARLKKEIADIKAKVDAEAAGKSSFTVDGKEHPVQMHGKVQDKIDKARKKFVRKGEEGDFYEMHQDLYTELSQAKKSHSDKVSKDPEQESAERDESMSREMNEPSPNQKKKCSKRSYK